MTGQDAQAQLESLQRYETHVVRNQKMRILRREFLRQTVAGAVTPLAAAETVFADAPAALPQEVALENEELRAVLDPSTGSLLELSNKRTGRQFQGRRKLARSFVMVAPLPERLLHIVDGLKQRVTDLHSSPDRLEFTWDGLQSEYAGRLDIRLVGSVTLSDAGLTFEMTIRNGSPLRIESVAWPYIGDLKRPAGELRRADYSYCNLSFTPLAPRFRNERGYWGTEYPIQMVPTPESPWVLILDSQEGLYAGCHDLSAKERIEFTFQLKPGFGRVDEVPPGDEIGGQVVNLEFFPTHLPFVPPGESYTISPIVLKPFQGDWHAGADCYKAWRRTWMRQPYVPAWIRPVHSWQMLQMTTWGDSLRIRYNELEAYAAECARHGVTGIQLIGWTLYGQDGRLPIHDIDPRLGTREELRAAIAKAREMGVHIVLYEKYTCADEETDWYKKELHTYASKDIFGHEHGHEGWRYDTPAHLAGINTRPYAWMCMNSRKWREIAIDQIRKSLDLSPAGIFLDETQWHGINAFYCFDPKHGHRVPAYNFAGDAAFEDMLRELIDGRDKELVLGGEGCYDLQNRHYNISYHRAGVGHVPAIRYIDPWLPMMNWVYGYDDREGVNICLLYRYIISYEPRNFRGHLKEFPLTLEYGKKMDALRRRYHEFLWDAEFQDTIDATVREDGGKLVYSVFRHARSDRKAVVVVNHGSTPILAEVKTGASSRQFTAVSPEEPEPRASDGKIRLPARSAIVLIES